MPGGVNAEDERLQYSPQTWEGFYASNETHRNNASATVSNNLDVAIDGHDEKALIDTGVNYSVFKWETLSPPLECDDAMGWPENSKRRWTSQHASARRSTAGVDIHGETCPVKFVVL